VGSGLQAIFGPRSENLMTDMQIYLESAGDEAELSALDQPSEVSYAEAEVKPKLRDQNAPQKVADWLSALGGADNISTVEPCAQTRLRIRVKNRSAIDEGLLREKGIGAMVSIDETLVHLLTGLNADQYAAEMTGQIAGG
jgi:PTS system glucose-specific IIC component